MKIAKTVETMRTIVRAYDDFEERKERIKSKTQKVKNKTQNILKGGNTMKFGTILGIVVGALTLIGAGAAAMYFYLKGGCDCCCDCEEREETRPAADRNDHGCSTCNSWAPACQCCDTNGYTF